MWLRYLFLLITLSCFAQQPSHYIVGEEDLAGTNIYSVLQAKDNRVWFSTNNGLYSYDGALFSSISAKGIKDLSLFGLTLDKEGRIYCHNLSGQVLMVENNALKVYCQIPSNYIASSFFIEFDDENKLVVSCKDLIRYNPKAKKFSKLFDFKDDIAEKLARDEQFKIYFWNDEKKYHLSKGNVDESLEKVPRLSLIQNHAYYKKDGQFLYFANLSNKAFLQKNDGLLKSVSYQIPNDASVTYRPLLSNYKDLIWLAGSKNGAYCYHTNGTPLFNNNKLFSDYFISAYLEDREGNVWLCTFGKGIIMIPNMSVIDYSNVSLLKDDDLTQITAKENTLFLGGVKGNVYALDKDKLSVKSKGFNKIEFLKYESKSNRIYVNDKVFDGNLKKELFKNDYNKYDVFENKKNDSVFYVTRSGLFYLDKMKKNHQLGYTTRTYGVFNDEENNTMWLASSTGLEIKQKGIFKKIEVGHEEIFSNGIVGINGQVWVSSTTGIYVFQKNKLIRHLTTKNKLLSDRIIKIIYQSPYVYVATNEGLQRFTADFKKHLDFTKAEGLLSNAILDFEILGSMIYVVSSKGLQCFDFNTIVKRGKLPEVLINRVFVNGADEVKNNSVLPTNENTLQFSFKAVSFLDKRNLKYRYRLKGYDDQWQSSDFFDNIAVYNKLPAGEYIFEVQLTDGLNTSESKEFVFEIEPVFWKKWQFIVMVLVLFALLLFVVYRMRINYLLEKSQKEIEKEKFSKEINKSKLAALNAQMNPHFMFNALNSIQEFILQNKKEQASNYLGDFADLMRSYLQHSQEDSIMLNDEIEMLKLYLKLEKLRFDDDFVYDVNVGHGLDIYNTRIPSFLIQPFVENSIKHGLLHKKNDRRLIVSIEKDNDEMIICKVLDNGIGRERSLEINKNKKHKSFATQASVDRFQLINQNVKGKVGIEIKDLYDENDTATGTEVILKIPVKKT